MESTAQLGDLDAHVAWLGGTARQLSTWAMFSYWTSVLLVRLIVHVSRISRHSQPQDHQADTGKGRSVALDLPLSVVIKTLTYTHEIFDHDCENKVANTSN